jgi:hypothetical protein
VEKLKKRPPSFTFSRDLEYQSVPPDGPSMRPPKKETWVEGKKGGAGSPSYRSLREKRVLDGFSVYHSNNRSFIESSEAGLRPASVGSGVDNVGKLGISPSMFPT